MAVCLVAPPTAVCAKAGLEKALPDTPNNTANMTAPLFMALSFTAVMANDDCRTAALYINLWRPTMFARIGVMRAINRHKPVEFDPKRKSSHWGKRKLKRDEWTGSVGARSARFTGLFTSSSS
jgi:hypothetical protein